jgi:hypothetical protein
MATSHEFLQLQDHCNHGESPEFDFLGIRMAVEHTVLVYLQAVFLQ